MGAVAFHTFVYALEQSGGLRPSDWFSTAVRHVSDGFLPFERHVTAGTRMRRASESQIEHWISAWSPLNLNPFTQVFRNAREPELLAGFLNAYASLPQFSTSTVLEATDPYVTATWSARRVKRGPEVEDPQACASAAIASYMSLVRRVNHNHLARPPQTVVSISMLARMLDVQGLVTAEVAMCLEQEPRLSPHAIAKALHCSTRTLQRCLASEDASIDGVRRAVRLLHATQLLMSDEPMTGVAVLAGYSDLPHMDRAFRRATNATPGFLRTVAHGLPLRTARRPPPD